MRRTISTFLCAAALAAATTACGYLPNLLDHHYFHSEEQTHAAAWSYTGATGPEHWGDLSPDYHLAKDGHAQSPIDLAGSTPGDATRLRFDYRPAQIDLVYNGHTIQETEHGESCLTVDGTRFVLEQFHFHSPSEHTVDGKHHPMEMHLVHKGDDGRVAVVAVFLDEGPATGAFDPVWRFLPSDVERHREANVAVDTAGLIPDDRSFFHYQGSFTTPPCTEGVDWFVMRTPLTLSGAEMAAFRAVIDNNNRPVQPRHGRRITTS